MCVCVLQLVYHSLQLVAFAVLAVLIMRLKLFLTPHMCIMASLICSRQVCPLPPSPPSATTQHQSHVCDLCVSDHMFHLSSLMSVASCSAGSGRSSNTRPWSSSSWRSWPCRVWPTCRRSGPSLASSATCRRRSC